MARRNYTDLQKAEVLKKAEETSISEASYVYGVAQKTIRRWKAEAKVDAGKIEVRKKTRAAGRKIAGALSGPAKKAAGDVKDAADCKKKGHVTMIFQSAWGGEITPEKIALKLPKEATIVYVKIEENKAYWVDKNGETGSVDIW